MILGWIGGHEMGLPEFVDLGGDGFDWISESGQLHGCVAGRFSDSSAVLRARIFKNNQGWRPNR